MLSQSVNLDNLDCELMAVMIQEEQARRPKRDLRFHPIYDSLAESVSDFDRSRTDIGMIVTPPENFEMRITLATRLNAIAQQFDPALSHAAWQSFCAEHPAAKEIIADVTDAFSEGRGNEIMDEIEKLGYLPAFNRAAKIFTITFSTKAVQHHSHQPLDHKNHALISRLNETPVSEEHKPVHRFEEQVTLTWSFGLNNAGRSHDSGYQDMTGIPESSARFPVGAV